jgi:aminomethyltransferase
MALIDSDIEDMNEIEIDIRGKRLKAVIVPYLVRKEAPPFTRQILWSPPDYRGLAHR